MANTTSYSVWLGRLTSNIITYVDIITFIIGPIGCIGNLITYSSQQMRRSSAALYLICATISQLVTILVCDGIRVFYDHSGSNLQNQVVMFCKFRYYLAITLPALASYYVALASFDRFLCTSDDIRMRAWSQIKAAKLLALTMLIVSVVMPIHILILYDIYNNLCQINPTSVYRFIYAGYLIIVVIFLPHSLMLIFSLLTVINLRKSRQRVVPTTTGDRIPNRRKAFEVKFIQIIVVQVFLSILLSLMRFGSASYRNIVFNIIPPTTDQRAVVSFNETVGSSLYFFNYAISFYVSILTSKFFRNAFYERIFHFYHRYLRPFVQTDQSY